MQMICGVHVQYVSGPGVAAESVSTAAEKMANEPFNRYIIHTILSSISPCKMRIIRNRKEYLLPADREKQAEAVLLPFKCTILCCIN